MYFKHDDVMEIDHIVASINNGSNNIGNKQIVHGHCHDVKTSKDLYQMKMG